MTHATNRPLRALIVDDEQLARRGLEIRLQRETDVEVCGQVGNGRQALSAIDELSPDIVFLDIQMPGMDGFETLRRFAGPDMPVVIFVTAFAEHAIRAFEANALDYLLKPIDDRRLAEALEKARAQLMQSGAAVHRDRLLRMICQLTGKELTLDEALGSAPRAAKIAIREGDETVCVPVQDIDWVEAAGDYLCIHANQNTHVLRGTMKGMEQALGDTRFARVHRSTIVNLDRVRSYRNHTNGEYFLTLEGEKEVKVSRSYKQCVQRLHASR